VNLEVKVNLDQLDKQDLQEPVENLVLQVKEENQV